MATSTEPLIVYDKKELAQFAKVIRNMSEIAVEETKRRVGELAQRELNEIRQIASSRGKVADRVAQGGKVKKSSLLGEVSFGFASQICTISKMVWTDAKRSGFKGLVYLSYN